MDGSGKTAVITGASRGLGSGLAEAFARRGVRLGLCARGKPALAESASVLYRSVDVADEGGMAAFAEAVAERFGTIHLWINNAGILEPIAPLRSIASADYRRHLEVNVLGVFHGTRAYVNHLRGRRAPGVLINISSGASRNPYAGWSAYCAGKAAVDLMTECVQIEEREAGLRAHAVAPGIIDTDMQTTIRAAQPEAFPEVEKFRQLKRDNAFHTPDWVADRLFELAFTKPRDEVRIDLRG